MGQKYVGSCPAAAQPGDLTTANGKVVHLWHMATLSAGRILGFLLFSNRVTPANSFRPLRKKSLPSSKDSELQAKP
jgi:hypothetical protein